MTDNDGCKWIPVTERMPESGTSVLVYFKNEAPWPTVYEGRYDEDRIRAMNDEELAKFLADKYQSHAVLRIEHEGVMPTATLISELYNVLYSTWLKWLKQPAEDKV